MLTSNIPPEYPPGKFNEFFVGKIEEIRSSFDPDKPITTDSVEFSGTVFEEFLLVTEDFVKTILQEMPKCLVTSTPYPLLSYVWMKLFEL